MKGKIKVLLIEDEKDLGNILKLYLETDSFQVILFESGEEAWKSVEENIYDIAIIDVNLPGMSGFDFAQNMKLAGFDIPFIFLTARKLKEDIVAGLKLGADDYIIKPFDAEVLVLKINNILKRHLKDENHIGIINEYQVNLKELKLIHPLEVYQLTQREAELLLYLSRRPNQLIKTSDILVDLWGKDDYFLNRSFNVFISRLRKFLSRDPRIKLINIRGVGYELRLE